MNKVKVPKAQTHVALWQLRVARRTLEDWKEREEERSSELTEGLDHIVAAIDIITEVLKTLDTADG